ncbi:tetraacyldisaccharide 4'-kinase [Xanthomonas sp. Mitacek01]|nr:tetraacyldisaccharide 4'-kinase [Xanthomonas sp. Mitacek01]
MKAPRYWFDGSAPPLHARALARVYGAAARLRQRFVRPRKVSRPVLVIGNLIAGGSGKTPLAIAVVERLKADGWTPGVASRGYGRDEAGTPRWVEPVTDPKLAGDEPVLIAARTAVKVRVDADRVAAAEALIGAGCDIVVCDDGLQHRRLRRDIEIEVIDGRRRYGNGLLIPAGPMREPAARSADCDFRVLNVGVDADIEAGFGEWPMRLETGQALPLIGGRPLPLARFKGQRVHAVAGIGDPERFFATLRAHGIAVVPHAFADHHRYTPEDLRFGSDLPVLMTEKDAVKCMRFAGERHYSVPVSGTLPEAFWIALQDRLAKLR